MAIIILIVGYFTVISPKLKIKEGRAKVLSTLSKEVRSMQSESESLSRYSDNLLEFTSKEEWFLSLALPDEFDLPSIVVQLTKLASDNKFIVNNIAAEPVNSNGVTSGNLKKVDIEMSVNGVEGSDYGNFSNFIDALESSIMIFDVNSISFTPNEIGYKLELSTYYYPNDESNDEE
jgi:Tfp pilus assembly protein PilO